MENFNVQFFEEFTKLDKACASVYQMEDGTFDYLWQMGHLSAAYADLIPSWNEDLTMLHRYRAVYQALCQSSDAFQEGLCSQQDVAWVQTFADRIMARNDPLALLQKRGYLAEDAAKQRLDSSRESEPMMRSVYPHDRYVNGPLFVGIIVVAVILTCLFCTFVLPSL